MSGIEKIYVDSVALESYGILLSHKNIGPATPQTSSITVPGRDGEIDVTDFIGVYYSNREITADLLVRDTNKYESARSELEKISGTKCKIEFSDDPSIYWYGRVSLTKYERSTRGFCKATLTMNAEPWPYSSTTGEAIKNV